MTLPPFPVDDQTLDLLTDAINGTSGEGGRSSVGDLCQLYSELGGSDLDAVEEDDGRIRVMRDPQYHPNDIIAALVDEVRRLRWGPG
ncbi:MAG TPA: hypothetical protein VGJ95_06800 [Pseudonocardiaceae bacterium]|jgi:hypothetical protein